MSHPLAAATRPDNPAGLIEQLFSFELPSQQQFTDALEAMGAFQGVVILAVGVAILLQGWKSFKLVAVLNAAVIGGVVGSHFGGRLDGENLALIGGVTGGLLLAVLAWPAMKAAISVMAAAAGAAIGYGVWHYAAVAVGQDSLTEHAWAGALLGMVTLGLLAFVVFQFVVVTLTSVQGSAMAVSGLVSLLYKHPDVRDPLHDTLTTNAFLPPLIVAVPVLIGFVFQYAAVEKKRKKKRKSSSDGGGG
ncbi:MAG: hypothetical protein ACLFVW_09705 [Phycisphaerae bacterium]